MDDKATGWKNNFNFPEKDGISLRMWVKPFKEINGRVVMRAESWVRDFTVPMYHKFIKDFEKKGVEGNKSIKEFKIIEKDENPETGEENSLMFLITKVPLFSNRESLLRNRMYWVEDGKSMMIIQGSEEHPDYPINKGNVRMNVQKAVKITQHGPDCHAYTFSTFDMGGYFPVRLLNMVMAGSMKQSMPTMTKAM